MKRNLNFKTDIFYQREEKDETVEITFLGLPFIHMLFWFVIFISILSFGKFTTAALFAFLIGLLAYVGLSWKALVEIRAAMLADGVLVIGSHLSIQNPLRVIIKK